MSASPPRIPSPPPIVNEDMEVEERKVNEILPNKPNPVTLPEGWSRVSQILCYNLNDILGEGDKSVVYKGKFGGDQDARAVAVKRIEKHNNTLTEKEIAHLKHLDSHDNVIRMHYYEKDNPMFFFLVLELCLASLFQYVEDKTKRELINLPEKVILRQATTGLSFLHSNNIVHRDLKPQNVLFAIRGDSVRAVLSDFGLCKTQRHDKKSLSKSSGVRGTDGWIAPEALNRESTSFPMDVFSLGCIFHYVLTKGVHPYGKPLFRNTNIVREICSIKQTLIPEARRLISSTLNRTPSKRPTAAAILIHPYFWSARKQLDFICDAACRLEKEPKDSRISVRLQQGFRFETSRWSDLLCEVLKKELENSTKQRYCKYDEYVTVPDGFMQYFTSRFPELLIHVHKTMEWCSDEPDFRRYYSDEERARAMEEKALTEDKSPIDLYNPRGWRVDKKFEFLRAVAALVNDDSFESKLTKRLQWKFESITTDWKKHFCRTMRDYYLSKQRKLQGWSIRSLLKTILNITNEYDDLDYEERHALGDSLHGLAAYIDERFPDLFIHVYYAAMLCADDKAIRQYYAAERIMQAKDVRR